MQLKTTATDLASNYAARAYAGAEGATAGSADLRAGFASLLRQSQSIAPPPPAPVSPPPPPPQTSTSAPPAVHPAATRSSSPPATDDDTAPEAATDAAAPPAAEPASDAPALPPTPADTARTLLRARLRAADGNGAGKTAKAAKADAAEPPSTTPASTDKPAASTDAAGPNAAALAAALPPPVLPLPPEATRSAGHGTDASSDAATDLGRAAPRIADPATADLGPAAAAGRDAATIPSVGDGGSFAALLADTRPETVEATPSRSTAVVGVGAATPSATAFGPTANAGTATAQPVDVPTPVSSPDFAQHLGVQVSLLAKDGVQHAELHLNPADMGPVSVQITLEGTQARIDFGADVAATRHAIESGLPQLAGALADAGFTLAGGGVSQHAGGDARGGGRGAPTPGDGRDGRGPASSGTGSTTTVSAARRTVRIGGLDLYA